MIRHRNKVALTCPSCEQPFAIEIGSMAGMRYSQPPDSAWFRTCPLCGAEHREAAFQGDDIEYFNAAHKPKDESE